MKIDAYTRGVRVRDYELDGLKVLLLFAAKYVKVRYESGGKKVAVETYATAFKNRRQMRFHRGQLDGLLTHLRKHGIEYTLKEHRADRTDKIELDYIDTRTPEDHQKKALAHCKSHQATSMIALQTGRGKTYIALALINAYSVRTMINVMGGYVAQWVEEVQKAFNIEESPTGLYVIRGRASLIKLMKRVIAGEPLPDMIIASLNTLQVYIKAYAVGNGKSGYPMQPDVFLRKLRVGLRITDEVHQMFHFNYLLDTYTNVKQVLALSATLDDPKDSFVNSMYQMAYPADIRFTLPYIKYIDTFAVFYSIKNIDKVKTTVRGRKDYSHAAFEQSLMANKKMWNGYMDVIDHIYRVGFVDIAEDDKMICIIYASLVEACESITDYMKKKHPDISILCYTSGVPFSEVRSGKYNVIVTTVGSLGTAKDVKGVRTLISTRAIGKESTNIQIVGRARIFRGREHIHPRFYYLVCRDIPVHVKYHKEKHLFLEDKVLSMNQIIVPSDI